MSLNIKNQEAPRLARELAESTGESMATAVSPKRFANALSVCAKAGTQARSSALSRSQENVRPGGRSRSVDHRDLFYDEKGLPK
jgi:hypothetical protein